MVRLGIRTFLTVVVLLLMLLPFYITYAIKAYSVHSRLVRIAFYIGTVLWGIRVKIEGRVSEKRPLLIVSNHFSYLDVFALGSAIDVRFTPKSEIASWPVIGFFCKITGCVFIDRRIHKTMDNKNTLNQMMQTGVPISLFPEGTTNDGTGLLPFKSSFFSIAEQGDVYVQPVSVVYTRLNDVPLTSDKRHLVGWYGDMEFFPHVTVFLQQKHVDVMLIFHEAVNGSAFASRKELAQYCDTAIRPSIRL